MGKKFEIQAINRALYESRNKKGVTLKEAAKALKINRLHLKLIELGYLHVSKKIQPHFIKYYQLDKNFFTTNSTYVSPINIKYEDPKIEEKIRARMRKPHAKIISGVVSLLMIGVIATGVYYFNRHSFYPRAAWSEQFTQFRQNVINNPDGTEISLEYPGDTAYYIENTLGESYYRVSIPSQDVNASGLVARFHRMISGGSIDQTVFAYNAKKIIVSDGDTGIGSRVQAVATYQKMGEYIMNKITIIDDDGIHDYLPGTPRYELWRDNLLNIMFPEAVNSINSRISYCLPTYNFASLMDDMQKISTNKVFGFRLGIRLMFIPSLILVLSLASFVYALVKGRKHKTKPKKKAKPYVVHETKYTANAELVYRSVPNDTVFPSIIPECALRILALAILLLASIGTVWVTQSMFTGQRIEQAIKFNSFISNIFVAGTTLAFFLKLDVYHKKSNKELLKNIITLFVIGLVFYVAECLLYACLSNSGSIYSILVKMLATFIPGNIIWNLMLYSLIFFFLFTLPKKLEKAPHKILLWRLCSLIPTFLMLVAFIFQGTFKGSMSQYISFLFYTNGALLTGFAIFYLYSLFFLQQYVRLKYGDETVTVYLDSRRYALDKNILASIIILFLVGVDLLFRFYAPYNGLNLGNNWAIALLIPFIILYRPHIGKRSPKWDLVYTVLYAIFLVGGFIISLGLITNSLDLSEIADILK